jgi:iron complex outermembrane receptor protein
MYRAYGKYLNRDQGFRHDSLNVDDWDLASGGFRAEKDKLTIHGDFYNGNVGQRTNRTIFDNPPTYALSEYVDVQGWNLFTKYQDEDWSLQGYWDVTKRDISSYGERRDKFDTEYTRILHATARQEIIWGVGSRVEFEDVKNTNDIRISETAQTDYSVNFFAQDEIQAFDERMKIIIGSKLEYNIYTHLEVQPNIRVLYHLNDNNQVWAAASRAVRTPTRIQTDSEITIYSPTLGYVRILGEQDLSSEDLASYELGYRTQPNKKMFFDLSFYANHYKDLVVYNTRDTIDVNGFSVRTFPFVNGMEGVVHGVELSGDVILQEWWKVKAYYALSKMSLGTNPNLPNLGVERLLEGGAPVQSAYLRSSFDLPYAIEFDSTLRYTDSYNHGAVPSLTELDLNVSKLIKGWQVALVGQNLLRNHHKESNTSLATQVERAGYMKVTRKF